MIRARALDVLAEAAESGEEDALDSALRAVDPLVRRAVRHRVNDALRTAERMAPRATSAHRFRLGYLLLAEGAPAAPPTSEPAIFR